MKPYATFDSPIEDSSIKIIHRNSLEEYSTGIFYRNIPRVFISTLNDFFFGERMRRPKLSLVLLAGIVLLLIALPIVAADSNIQCGCSSNIQVIPVGSKETGKPLITDSPANLIIFHTGQGPITNVWLLIVINKPTYDNLVSITVNGTAFMTKSDFQLVTDKKIPSENTNWKTGYPGSECQYEVAAIRSNMDEAKNSPVYYGLKFILQKITTSPTHFQLAVNLSGPAKLKALILGLGMYYPTEKTFGPSISCFPISYPFNRDSSFSKSTFVVPEVATLALTASPFGALGLYTVKRKKK